MSGVTESDTGKTRGAIGIKVDVATIAIDNKQNISAAKEVEHSTLTIKIRIRCSAKKLT